MTIAGCPLRAARLFWRSMEKTQHVELLNYTPNPEKTVAMAAKVCYSASDLAALTMGVSEKDQSAFIARLIEMKHLSPLEHVSFTFGIEGVSRALLAQITRHRIASFSVQSQRYVDVGKTRASHPDDRFDRKTAEIDFDYVVPDTIRTLGDEAVARYREQMQTIGTWYREWLDVLGEDKKEDARFVLPNACATRMIVTMNARELLHFFSLRCCNRAQWEIRNLAWEMLRLVAAVAPSLFVNAGPDCVRGACGQGKMSCGKPYGMEGRA